MSIVMNRAIFDTNFNATLQKSPKFTVLSKLRTQNINTKETGNDSITTLVL